jgi:hypothetical protein
MGIQRDEQPLRTATLHRSKNRVAVVCEDGNNELSLAGRDTSSTGNDG